MRSRLQRVLLSTAAALAGCGTTQAPQPGLWDAHTHVSWYGEEALTQLVASGVVAVRDCGGDAEQLQQWRAEIEAGKRAGPRIYVSGPALDGPKDAPFRMTITTPDEARRAVDELAAMKVDFIKTHNAIPRDAYFAALEQARRRGLRVASHLPKGVPAWEAADAGVGSIEHAAESLLASPIYAGHAADVDAAMAWWRSPAGDAALAHLAGTGVAITPTLVAYEVSTEMRRDTAMYAPRRRVLAFLIELTGRLHKAGIPLLAGSDFVSPEVALVPGQSLLREIELLRQAGLSQTEAFAAAGVNIERWFELSKYAQ
ncbi:MAG: amidohydrolase family protein [Steroidobacteraceae bacterium]